jgi:hypothetical protein
MNGNIFDYRGKEFAASCPHLINDKLSYRQKISLVEAVYEKARRTFRENVRHLLSDHPAGFGLYRVHLVDLGKSVEQLLGLKRLHNEEAVINDIDAYISSAMEDIVGITRACDIILTDDSSGH